MTKTIKTLRAFIASTEIDSRVIRAIVRNLGGWQAFKETAQDVCNHGADSGFSGFIYYTETEEFAKKYRPEIVAFCKLQAREYGMNTAEMVQGFNCLKGDFSHDEVIDTLHGPKSKGETVIYNALAWFMLEEVCRAFEYFSEE